MVFSPLNNHRYQYSTAYICKGYKNTIKSKEIPFSCVLCSQDLDLILLFLVFSLIFTVVSRLLLLYSTIDKTSRLKMKSFSTVRDTQRGSQSYMEKRKGRRELEVT